MIDPELREELEQIKRIINSKGHFFIISNELEQIKRMVNDKGHLFIIIALIILLLRGCN